MNIDYIKDCISMALVLTMSIGGFIIWALKVQVEGSGDNDI